MSATETLDPSTAAASLTGGQATVQTLLAQGVDTIFGLPGIQLDGLFAALHDEQARIRVLHPRHEQTCAYMADGYARVTGREGVCVVVPGPGVLNAAAGLSTAYSVSVPVLCVTGQIRSDLIGQGRGALHEIVDQLGMLRSVTKWAGRAETPQAIGSTLDEAFRQLRTGRARPVAFEAAPDVYLGEGALHGRAEFIARERPAGDPDALARAARLLGEAKTPVIVAGGGVERSGATGELLRVAELLEAPVVKTRNGKGAISDRHHLAMSNLAGPGLREKADVIVFVGTRFPDPIEGAWAPAAGQHVVHIDIDPTEFGRFSPESVDLVADAKAALGELANRIPAHNRTRASRKDELDAINAAIAARVNSVQPQAGYALAIRETMPDDGIMVHEFTQISYWSFLGMPVYAPNTFLTPGYQGTLGYGFPTAMGAKVGRPDVPVISITGDGGFGFAMNELSTIVRHGIPLVTVLFNDNAYGNVRRIQDEDYGGRIIASELVNPDFKMFAGSFGVPYRRAESPDALRVQLREALNAGEPCLIEVPIGVTPDPWKVLDLRQPTKTARDNDAADE